MVFIPRPGQHRGRPNSEHNMNRQSMRYQDAQGMLVPAAAVAPVHRSASARRSTQVVINNDYDPPSPYALAASDGTAPMAATTAMMTTIGPTSLSIARAAIGADGDVGLRVGA